MAKAKMYVTRVREHARPDAIAIGGDNVSRIERDVAVDGYGPKTDAGEMGMTIWLDVNISKAMHHGPL